MSAPRITTVCCPRCQEKVDFTIWETVNTRVSTELRERILDGSLFTKACPHCGYEIRLEYDMLYHDLQHQAMLWVVLQKEETYETRVREVRDTARLLPPGYLTRLVHTSRELQEKIRALQFHRDDRLMELCKSVLVREIQRQNPDFQESSCFYFAEDDQEFIMVIGEDEKETCYYLPEWLYDEAELLFSEALKKVVEGPYDLYDRQWAETFLNDILKSEGCSWEEFLARKLVEAGDGAPGGKVLQRRKTGIRETKQTPAREDAPESAGETAGPPDKEGRTSEPVPSSSTAGEAGEPGQAQPDGEATGVDASSWPKGKTVPAQLDWIRENPFFLLELSCGAGRRQISRAAEEKSFPLGAERCGALQSALWNPSQRLSWELDWFPGWEQGGIVELCRCIGAGQPLPEEPTVGISGLNGRLYHFSLGQIWDKEALQTQILDLNNVYGKLKPEEVAQSLNVCRMQANLPPVTAQEVSLELVNKRRKIQTLIVQRLAALSQSDYQEMMTQLAQVCMTQEQWAGSILISDLLDQYELDIRTDLEECRERIGILTQRIEHLLQPDSAAVWFPLLFKEMERWRQLTLPLQLQGQATGIFHADSENLGYQVRNTAISLQNEKGWTARAMELIASARAMLVGQTQLTDLLGEDRKKLWAIQMKAAKAVLAANLQLLQQEANGLQVHATRAGIDDFLRHVREMDEHIRQMEDVSSIRELQRESLCQMAMETALFLEKQRGETNYAGSILRALAAIFADMPAMRKQLASELQVLKAKKERQKEKEKTRKMAYMTAGFVVTLVIMLLFVFQGSEEQDSSYGYDSTVNGETSSSTSDQTTQTPAISSVSAEDGGEDTWIQADIVSIFPTIGIYWEDSYQYSHFVCECRDTNDATIWLWITASDYTDYFDPYMKTAIVSSVAETKVFSTPKRIYGKIVDADNVGVTGGLDIDTKTVVEFDRVEDSG